MQPPLRTRSSSESGQTSRRAFLRRRARSSSNEKPTASCSLQDFIETYCRLWFHTPPKRTSLLTPSISMNGRKGVHGPSALLAEMVRRTKTAHLAATRHRERMRRQPDSAPGSTPRCLPTAALRLGSPRQILRGARCWPPTRCAPTPSTTRSSRPRGRRSARAGSA